MPSYIVSLKQLLTIIHTSDEKHTDELQFSALSVWRYLWETIELQFSQASHRISINKVPRDTWILPLHHLLRIWPWWLSRSELGQPASKSWWSKMQNSSNEDILRTEDVLRTATLLWYDVIGTMTKTTVQAAIEPPLNKLGRPRPTKIRWRKPREKSWTRSKVPWKGKLPQTLMACTGGQTHLSLPRYSSVLFPPSLNFLN